MPLTPETLAAQKQLAQFCRSGERQPIPGTTSPERVEVYRSLIRNIVDSALVHAYPILHSTLQPEEWSTLVNDLLQFHDLPDPQLWRMPKELYHFVRDSQYGSRLNLPVMTDLCLFEWLEIEAHMMPDTSHAPCRLSGNLISDTLVVNPNLLLSRFEHPVFRMKPREAALSPGLYFLATYRHPQTLHARYIELSPLWARVLERLLQAPGDLMSLIPESASELGADIGSEWQPTASETAQRMLDDGVLLGFLREE